MLIKVTKEEAEEIKAGTKKIVKINGQYQVVTLAKYNELVSKKTEKGLKDTQTDTKVRYDANGNPINLEMGTKEVKNAETKGPEINEPVVDRNTSGTRTTESGEFTLKTMEVKKQEKFIEENGITRNIDTNTGEITYQLPNDSKTMTSNELKEYMKSKTTDLTTAIDITKPAAPKETGTTYKDPPKPPIPITKEPETKKPMETIVEPWGAKTKVTLTHGQAIPSGSDYILPEGYGKFLFEGTTYCIPTVVIQNSSNFEFKTNSITNKLDYNEKKTTNPLDKTDSSKTSTDGSNSTGMNFNMQRAKPAGILTKGLEEKKETESSDENTMNLGDENFTSSSTDSANLDSEREKARINKRKEMALEISKVLYKGSNLDSPAGECIFSFQKKNAMLGNELSVTVKVTGTLMANGTFTNVSISATGLSDAYITGCKKHLELHKFVGGAIKAEGLPISVKVTFTNSGSNYEILN